MTEAGLQLRNLLLGYVDEHTQDSHPGLISYYPTVVALTATKSGRGGSGTGGNVPLDTAALDFCSGAYWSADGRPMPDTEQARNPDNYRPGFEMTVLGLVDTTRAALDMTPAILPRAVGQTHAPRPDVFNGLRWLSLRADDIADRHPVLFRNICVELTRLWVHVYGVVWGSSKDVTHSQCPHCYQVESVWSNGTNAVCITPGCRTESGARWCWELVGGEWQAIAEPDAGDGTHTDEDLQRWSDVS